MSALDKTWQVYIGGSHVGTLTPTSSDDNWYYANFAPGEAWGNFAPWFQQAAAGDADAHNQLLTMGLQMVADQDGETVGSPQLYIDGNSAWFVV